MYKGYKYNDNTRDMRDVCASFAAKRARARMARRALAYIQYAGAVLALVGTAYIVVLTISML